MPSSRNWLGFACSNGGDSPVLGEVKCVWQHQQNYAVSSASVFMIRQLRGKKCQVRCDLILIQGHWKLLQSCFFTYPAMFPEAWPSHKMRFKYYRNELRPLTAIKITDLFIFQLIFWSHYLFKQTNSHTLIATAVEPELHVSTGTDNLSLAPRGYFACPLHVSCSVIMLVRKVWG